MAIGNTLLIQVILQSVLCTAFDKIVSKFSPYNILVGGFGTNPDSKTISTASITGINASTNIAIAGYNGVTFA
jgi:hypothetical protein